ncbi:MAG: N-(5'-phosphoribosyl)anthranilate isomerase [Phycisphaerales bacterium]
MTNDFRPRTRIKVCGITNPEDAAAAVEFGADALGFIFVEDTPRYIEPEEAAAIMHALPPFVSAVGVVRDLDVDAFCELEQLCPCPLMQLHGKEPEKTVAMCGPGVVKAFRYDSSTIRSQLDRWAKVDEVDALLVDGSDGGAGEAFDWNELAGHLEDYEEKPIIVAGGLGPGNVADAIRALRPYAVDVSSGVEAVPGRKDHEKLAGFIDAVRRADLG